MCFQLYFRHIFISYRHNRRIPLFPGIIDITNNIYVITGILSLMKFVKRVELKYYVVRDISRFTVVSIFNLNSKIE